MSFAHPISRPAAPMTARGARTDMGLLSAFGLFLGFASPRVILLLLAVSVAVRIVAGPFGAADAIVAGVVPLYWSIQEWTLHRFVLHLKPFAIGGRRIDFEFARRHREHHARPWSFREAFLPVRVILVAMAINVAVWLSIASTRPLALTGIASIVAMSLVYEWIHFLTHAPYRPRSRWFSRVCHNHRRHHFKNEHYWYAFVLPSIDSLLGTAPDWRNVETSPTCLTLGVIEAEPAGETVELPRPQ